MSNKAHLPYAIPDDTVVADVDQLSTHQETPYARDVHSAGSTVELGTKAQRSDLPAQVESPVCFDEPRGCDDCNAECHDDCRCYCHGKHIVIDITPEPSLAYLDRFQRANTRWHRAIHVGAAIERGHVIIEEPTCHDCPAPPDDYEVDDGNPRCDGCAEIREKLIERNRREASRESALEYRAVMRMEEGA